MKALLLLLLALMNLFVRDLYAQTTNGKKVYVWEFQSENINNPELMDRMSGEFEVAVQATGKYNLIQRRNMARLLSRRSNEVIDRHHLGNDDVQLLKGEGADGVFFGDVFDDKGDGTVSLTVTLESFSGAIEFERSVSMKPFELNSSTVRKAKYEELLGGTKYAPGPVRQSTELGNAPHPPPASRPEITSFRYHFINRGERSGKGLIAFDWSVAPLPDGNCKYSLYVGNTAVGAGNQTNMPKHIEVSFLSHLAQETKSLKVFCGGKEDDAQGVADTPGAQ